MVMKEGKYFCLPLMLFVEWEHTNVTKASLSS